MTPNHTVQLTNNSSHTYLHVHTVPIHSLDTWAVPTYTCTCTLYVTLCICTVHIYMYVHTVATYMYMYIGVGVLASSQFLPLTCTYLLHNLWRIGGTAWWIVSHEWERLWRGTWEGLQQCTTHTSTAFSITHHQFRVQTVIPTPCHLLCCVYCHSNAGTMDVSLPTHNEVLSTRMW